MSIPLFTNNASTTLALGIGISDTTINLYVGSGSLFPSPVNSNYFYISMISSSTNSTEIMKCTGRSGDTLTVVRAQDGTSAQTWSVGDRVELRVTAASLNFFANGSSANPSTATQVNEFTAIQGQTTFTLSFNYLTNSNNLVVFVNGSKQIVSVNYNENSSSTIQFLAGLNVGDLVEVIYNLPFASGSVDASNITYNQGSTGAVITNVQAKLQQTVSVNDFGAGSTALTNALAAANVIYIPTGVTVTCTSTVSIGDNKKIIGGGIIQGSGAVAALSIDGNNVIIDDINFDINALTTNPLVVFNTTKNSTIQNCRFYGASNAQFIGGGANAYNSRVINNTFGVDGSAITSPYIFFDQSTNSQITGNTFYNTIGFGIQIRCSTVGKLTNGAIIANNNFYQPYTDITYTVTAGAGQTSHAFTTTATSVQNYTLLANGVPIPFSATGSYPTYTLTYASQSVGVVMTFRSWAGLENIQLNGNVTGVTISNNLMDGCGDAGINLGNDYGTGNPFNITITGNVVKNCYRAGINEDVADSNVNIVANQIIDCGQGYFNTYPAARTSNSNAGISVNSGSYEKVVSGNIVSSANISSYGIFLNGNSLVETGEPNKKVYFGNNGFQGTFQQQKYWINQSNNALLMGNVLVTDGNLTPYPAQINLDTSYSGSPANTAYFTYGVSGSGWTYDTTNKFGGTACLTTIAGSYVDTYMTTETSTTSFFTNSIIKVSFWAKAQSGSSYVSVFGTYGGAVYTPATVTITSTSWTEYTMSIPCYGLVNVYAIRIGSTTGTASIQYINIQAIQYK